MDLSPEDSEEDWVHIEREGGALLTHTRGFEKSEHHAMTPHSHKAAHDKEQATSMKEQSSFFSVGETPSRHELLSIVRKHSSFLKDGATSDKNKGSGDELDMRFWREMTDMFFVRGLTSLKAPQDDDLVFFVRHTKVDRLSEQTNSQPYFVRRWASQLEKVIGDSAKEVDWHRSFYLNLIAHTTYTLTVAICKREALQNRQKNPGLVVSPIYQISKTVYASPSRVNFQMDTSKGFETVPAYPDICFMVDDYDDTFEEVILVEPDHCYCVFLNADGGATFSPEDLTGQASKRISPETYLLGDPKSFGTPKLTLFSGFVGYDMVRSAFEGGRSRIGGLLLIGSSSARSERLLMHGPGGRGEVEVSVLGLPDESTQSTSQEPSLSSSKPASKFGTIMRKAAVAASLAAKQAYVASAGVRDDMEALPLRCCLMSLSLPWDVLANDLLFKDFPNEQQ